MVERKINICDMCQDRAAKCTCSVCEKDLCNTCSKKIPLLNMEKELPFIIMIICKKCSDKIWGLVSANNTTFADQLIKQTATLIQSSNMLNELED